MTSSKKLSPGLERVLRTEERVAATKRDLQDAIEYRNSAVTEAINTGEHIDDVAEILGVTATDVDKMLAADRQEN